MTDDASHSPFAIRHSQLICCGGLRTDYIITAQNDVRLMEMGGNALFAAAGAKLWLDHIAILARAGESYPSGWIDDLHDYGFDVRGIRRVAGLLYVSDRDRGEAKRRARERAAGR